MEVKWPTTREEWLKFDLTQLKPGTAMPFKVEHPPEKYIVNGLLQKHLIPKEERLRYMLPCHEDEPEISRNADGSIIIVDEKQKQIDALSKTNARCLEAYDRLTEHLSVLTKQVNVLTKQINPK